MKLEVKLDYLKKFKECIVDNLDFDINKLELRAKTLAGMEATFERFKIEQELIDNQKINLKNDVFINKMNIYKIPYYKITFTNENDVFEYEICAFNDEKLELTILGNIIFGESNLYDHQQKDSALYSSNDDTLQKKVKSKAENERNKYKYKIKIAWVYIGHH